MSVYRVTWRVADRHVEPHGDMVSGVGLQVTYQGRETGINIALPQPIAGRTPENEVALAEFRALRDALNDILGEQ